MATMSRWWVLVLGVAALLGAPVFADKPAQNAEDAGDEAVEPEEKPAAVWNVDEPRGPTFERAIDVTEGTWLSLDVSPDGKWIAFDLLGDLYMMPIEGDATGERVRKLTGGMSWDMQPRFSPCGTRLAFTSDRNSIDKDGKVSPKAGDNVWTIDLDSGELTQISTETFRLLNAPAWHPSGEYIVARKHFTSRRSLGSGEMWMYHSAGVHAGATGGVQLTEKPTDQKDVNEPVFSPCGRYLYFSEDASPGQNFEYNKDSNQQIYVINRLDTETGRQERYITGPGGSARPTPSPDGKKIAFVRRFDGRSALHIFDIRSGRVDMVHDDLERDMQEAWAIHGVYPTIAWTPDSQSIVFWARGQIRRIDLNEDRSAGDVRTIPFRVRDTRTLADPIRFPIDPAPDEVQARMLRWVQVSPNGKQVAYQALGKIWIKDLPDGTPRRLTEQNEHFEFYPSWSRDSRQIVYTTWHDEQLGSVRVADLESGETWRVTRDPGHYVEPAFFPLGGSVLYRKTTGGGIISPLWGREPGIYRVTAVQRLAPSMPELLTRDGVNPQFGSSNTRLYVTRTAFARDADNRKLIEIELGGEHRGHERELYTSTWAQDYRVSPDGKWVAFVERFNVHVAPLVRTGRTIAVGPSTTAIPVQRVGKDAGWHVHFSGDSKRLHWSLGPTLFTRELADSFAFLDGAPEKAPDLTAEGVDIGFTFPHDKPETTIALVGGTVYTMDPDAEDFGRIENATVLIEGNRITAVGPRGGVRVPRGAEVIDVSGQIVLPGFLEAHAHGPMAIHGITPQHNWVNAVRLAFGVTTVHDPSNDTASIFSSSEMTMSGANVGPRTFSTGTILYGAAGGFAAPVESYDDALFHLRRMQAVGAWSVKSYNQPRRDQRQQVVEGARELGMMVVPEGGSTFMHNLTMIVDGHTGIEHTFPVEIVYDDVLQLWKPEPDRGLASVGVGYTPTLSVAYGGLTGEIYWYQQDELWKHGKLRSFVPPEIIIPRARRRLMAPREDFNHFLCARITKQAIDIGIPVQPGGHGQMPGLNTHWEIWMMAQGGMSNLEALRSGTYDGARHLGLDRDLGSITPGKLADLVIIQPGRDPTREIRDTEFIQWTIANGRVYNAKTMAERQPGGELAPAPRFYWMDPNYAPSSVPPAFAGCEGCGYPTACSWGHP